MTKYLALFKVKETTGLVFYNDLENVFELSVVSLDKIKDKVDYYQPEVFLFSSLQSTWANRQMREIRPDFLTLRIFYVDGVKELEKEIIAGNNSIPGLERKLANPAINKFYPSYHFGEKNIKRDIKRTLLVLYLHKPWQEVSRVVVLRNEITPNKKNLESRELFADNEINKNSSQVFISSELLKNINMNELNPQVKELSEKLTQMSKLSYLGTLKSQEILFLVENTRKFTKILENFYTLKKNEESEELKQDIKTNNNNESNLNDN